jgi:hypothetical protein
MWHIYCFFTLHFCRENCVHTHPTTPHILQAVYKILLLLLFLFITSCAPCNFINSSLWLLITCVPVLKNYFISHYTIIYCSVICDTTIWLINKSVFSPCIQTVFSIIIFKPLLPQNTVDCCPSVFEVYVAAAVPTIRIITVLFLCVCYIREVWKVCLTPHILQVHIIKNSVFGYLSLNLLKYYNIINFMLSLWLVWCVV